MPAMTICSGHEGQRHFKASNHHAKLILIQQLRTTTKTILINTVAALSLSLAGFAYAQSIPNPADQPNLGKPGSKCYKNGSNKLKKNRVLWNGRCYVKPDCDDGYYYGPSMGSCMQDNAGGE